MFPRAPVVVCSRPHRRVSSLLPPYLYLACRICVETLMLFTYAQICAEALQGRRNSPENYQHPIRQPAIAQLDGFPNYSTDYKVKSDR